MNNDNLVYMYPIFIRKGKHKYELLHLASKEQPKLRKQQLEELSKLSKKKIIRGTVVGVINGNTVRFGVAFLSHKDAYNKTVGKIIAYNRAIKLPIRIFNLTVEEEFTLKQTVEQAQNLVKAFANKAIPMQNPKRATFKKEQGLPTNALEERLNILRTGRLYSTPSYQ